MAKKTVAIPENAAPAGELPGQAQTPAPVSAAGAAAQNNARNIRLIIGREYKNYITQRSFIISTIIILVLVAIAAFIPTIVQVISTRTPTQTHIAVINSAGSIAGWSEAELDSYLVSALNGKDTTSRAPYAITIQSPASQERLQTQVKNGSLDLLLVLTRAAQGNLQFTYYSHTDPNTDGNLSTLQTIAQQLTFLDSARRLGLTPAQTSSLVAQPAFTVVNTQPQQDIRSQGQLIAGYVLGYVGNIMIYMAVMLYGMGVAMGVAEEKGSRVMEILVNAATPFQLMTGKIIGIGAAGLTQMVCLVLVGTGALLLQIPIQTALLGFNDSSFLGIFTGISIQFLLLLLVYFILGFLLYSTLFAALGALVKRQEEVRSAAQLPTMLLLIGYLVSYFAVYMPDATWVKVISYIPLWTPTTMLARLGTGTVAWWEIALTIGLMIVAILISTLISARIYRYGILMYGQRPGLRQLFKLARAN